MGADTVKAVKWENKLIDPGTDKSVKNIIFDTDGGPDSDDTAALTMLHNYANEGKVNLLATVCDTSTPYGASYLDAINTYYGRPDVLVGTYKGTDILPTSRGMNFNIGITAKYNTHFTDSTYTRDAMDVYRQVLAEAADNSITIVLTGMQSNLAALLSSSGDKHSPLNGPELVKKKVKLVACMGGAWPSGKEFNIEMHPESAKYVAENWPTPIVYSGYEIGDKIKTKTDLASVEADSPLRIAWRLDYYPSWDQTAALYAVEGIGDWWTIKRGDAAFTVDGENRFAENNSTGARFFLVSNGSASEAMLTDKISRLANAPKKNNPDKSAIIAILAKDATHSGIWTSVVSNEDQNKIMHTLSRELYSTATMGATITVNFKGSDIHIYGSKAVNGGNFEVYIDGISRGICDTSVTNELPYASLHLFSVVSLNDREHTLEIKLLDNKSVTFDFFKAVSYNSR